MKGNFQIFFLIIFMGLALFALMVFSGVVDIGKKEENKNKITITLWGTISKTIVDRASSAFGRNSNYELNYVQKSTERFNQDLLEALATKRGPDLFLLPNDLVLDYANKITKIPYTEYPISSFKSNFVSAGDVFLTQEGMLAYPLVVDPLMMYYNRTILDSVNIVNPPLFWDELIEMTPVLTKKNENKEIQRSAVAMGQFVNIRNAKEIISTLFLQTGNPILEENNNRFYPTLLDKKYSVNAINSSLDFYVSFANPLDPLYSWNISLPDSRDFFTSQNSAFYFGFASELRGLINRNPNLNFLVAPVPQLRESKFKATYSRVIGVAVSKSARNVVASKAVASLMATSDFSALIAKELNTAPVRKDLLSKNDPTNSFVPIFYASALFSRSWIDPSSRATNEVFRSMIERMLANTTNAKGAIADLNQRLFLLGSR